MSFFKVDDSYFNVLVNIGSGNLSVSLVLYKRNQPPSFIYTVNREVETLERVDLLKLDKAIISLFDQILLDVIKNGFKQINSKAEIKNVVVSLSAPWFFMKTKNVEINEPKPFTITENFIKKITEKEVASFEEDVRKINESPDASYSVVEKSIVNVKVNGYTISKIIGQKTNTLDAFICMSLVEENFIKNINDVVCKHTHLSKEKIIMHTLPIVTFSVIRDLFNGFNDFLIMDISSEYSDITYVSNGILNKTSSFPSGRNFIVRQIAKAMSVPNEIAESSLRLFVSKKLDDQNSKLIQEVLIEVEKEWSIYFEKSLSEVSPTGQFPARLYLSVKDDVFDIYLDMIKLQKADITSDFRKSVNIIKMDKSIFGGLLVNQSHTQPDCNIFLMAMFWNKFAFK